jgi:hypothetical protein
MKQKGFVQCLRSFDDNKVLKYKEQIKLTYMCSNVQNHGLKIYSDILKSTWKEAEVLFRSCKGKALTYLKILLIVIKCNSIGSFMKLLMTHTS